MRWISLLVNVCFLAVDQCLRRANCHRWLSVQWACLSGPTYRNYCLHNVLVSNSVFYIRLKFVSLNRMDKMCTVLLFILKIFFFKNHADIITRTTLHGTIVWLEITFLSWKKLSGLFARGVGQFSFDRACYKPKKIYTEMKCINIITLDFETVRYQYLVSSKKL